jgi:ABC-type branched-subunit amino acid transport system ATPase component/branched-subunit amino acid ABC-type transport system permease component
MSSYLVLGVVGLALGSVYAALASGLVVVYKGTGVINFACGAMAAWAAFVFDEFLASGDLVFPVVLIHDRIHLTDDPTTVMALGVAIGSAVGIAAIAHYLVFRPLRHAPQLARVVAGAGLMLALQTLMAMRFGTMPRVVPSLLPEGLLHIGEASVAMSNLYLGILAVVVGLGLWAYFRFTRVGLATRAAAESERNASLARFATDRLGLMTWILSSVVVAVTVILASPTIGLNPTSYTLYIVPALAAALVGRLDSIMPAVVAGLFLGVISAEFTFMSTQDWFPKWASTGVAETIPLLIVIIVLFLVGRNLPARGAVENARLPSFSRPRNRPKVVVPLVAAGIVLIVLTHGSYRFGVITSMSMAIAALSLVLLTGLVGQVSLAQAAMAGTAGFILSKLGTQFGLGFPLAPVLAALGATAIGVLIGLPALRIRGTQLAVVTLAAAVAVENFVFRNPSISPLSGNPVDPPSLFGIDLGIREGQDTARTAFALLTLAVLVLCALAVGNIARSATGRRFLAVRSNERAAAAVGIGVASSKLTAFALSAFLAGVCGTLIGYSRGSLSAESFTALVGVTWLMFAYLGGISSIPGAFVAGLLAPLGLSYVIFDRWLGASLGYQFVAAIGLILTAIFNPEGIAGYWRGSLERRRAKRAAARASVDAEVLAPAPPEVADAAAERSRPARTGEPLFAVDELTVSFGGLKAVDGCSLRVHRGEIVGLIGANGAGKTTLIDGVTGFVASSGSVQLAGGSLDGLPPHRRARRGLRRTWQSGELFGDLTVKENLLVAGEPSSAKSTTLDVFHPTRVGLDERAGEVLELVGLSEERDVKPAELPLGKQKLVGVARALMSAPTVVLFDEPAAGLSTDQSQLLGERLLAVLHDDMAMLLIEHDVELVLSVCDYVYVLDFGKLLAEGTPEEIRRNPAVVDAYLGTGAATEASEEEVAPA